MERARALQVALAIVLSGALFVETYALFDTDLGTPVPIFHELTCRGKLDVRATDGFGNATLRQPDSGLNASAAWGGALVPSYFLGFYREGTGPWLALPPSRDDRGWHVFFMERVTNLTQAYVEARDLSGTRCDAKSEVIGAGVYAPPRIRVPTLTPGPPTTTPIVAPPPPPYDCASVAIRVADLVEDDHLAVPTAQVAVNLTMDEPVANATFTVYIGHAGGDFQASPPFERGPGVTVLTIPTNDDTIAFVHIDFRPTFDCARDSNVLRARTSA